MKISFNWLSDYVDLPVGPEELAVIMTSLGLEVEGIEKVLSIPGGLEGLVVGKVLECEKHPNADRLSLTTVDIGTGEPLQIICGAPNVASGQKVVVAPVGTTLYPVNGEAFKIKKGKIRGEISQGMICAEDEIGAGTDREGIIVLPEDLPIGFAVAGFYEVESDTIYDIALTPNRSDATSHLGVAKDLLAYFRFHHDGELSLKHPSIEYEVDKEFKKEIKIEIFNKVLCPRFSGLIIGDLKIGPSPAWMQRRLTSIGVRPISNVVDITNYVLHEYGQPLHAYDISKIAQNRIHVRTLDEGTIFRSLDEKERRLSSEDLMVCDGNDKGMCIAGVFGGIDSGITDQTSELFLEAAYFEARSIRKTSTRHALRTDAAKCFEKGADPSMTVVALKRAAHLLTHYAGASVRSVPLDSYEQEIKPKAIEVRGTRINRIIGREIDPEDVERIFEALEIRLLEKTDTAYTVSIPTNKADVTREIDVIEEILRIYGFNNIPVPERLTTSITNTQKLDIVKLRGILSSLLLNKGFNETKAISLISSSAYGGMEIPESQMVKVNNTSNIQLDAMRPEMLMSAMYTVQHNIYRQQKNLSFFENGYSYLRNGDGFNETEWVTVFISGEKGNESWKEEARLADFFDLKTIVESILDRLGIENFLVSEIADHRFHFGLRYHQGERTLANCGAVHEAFRKKVDINQDVFYAELSMKGLLDAAPKSSTSVADIPKYPVSKRDLSIVLPENIKYDQVESIIRQNGGSLVKHVGLFDVYQDKNLSDQGNKSFAVSLTFGDDEKNLKDKVVDKIVAKIVSTLQNELGARLR